jgi:hypothetical protein
MSDDNEQRGDKEHSSERHSDYLWDRSGAVDTEIAELEDILGTLRFDEAMPAVEPPKAKVKPSQLWWLAVAAGFALVIWGWLAREGAELAPPVARMTIPSVDVSGALAAGPLSTPPAQPTGPGWAVTMVSGTPTCDGGPVDADSKLHIGGWVETDASSRAQIEVANIGTLDLEPGSRLRLLGTGENRHRVKLERGLMRASVSAPPRVFLVDTPKVTAVDLGCEYQLEVADDDSTWLRVRLGWVSLETKEVVSVVPAGAMCRADTNGIPGLPLRRAAPEALVEAAAKFASGSTDALQALLGHTQKGDEVTLWHLLSRVPATKRRAVYDKLTGITSESADEAAVLRMEKDALDAWGRALGVLPPIGWPDEGPPDPPAPEWRPRNQPAPARQPDPEGGAWNDPEGGKDSGGRNPGGKTAAPPGKRKDGKPGKRKDGKKAPAPQ